MVIPKYLMVLFITIGLFSNSCDRVKQESDHPTDQDTVQMVELESGLKIEILKNGEGAKPETGDFVSVHYTGRLVSNQEVFDSSRYGGKPFRFKIGVGKVIKGWDEGIAQLSKGAKARLIIPANLGYGSRDQARIPANSDLEFDVEVMDIHRAPKKQVVARLDTTGLAARTTNSGLRYFIVEEGTGPEVRPGSTVLVHYAGYLKENGKQFDNSYERGQPYTVTVGRGEVIMGWDEGLSLLSEGDKAVFEIPAHLAYKEKGFPGVIPPNATLIFDIQVMKVR